LGFAMLDRRRGDLRVFLRNVRATLILALTFAGGPDRHDRCGFIWWAFRSNILTLLALVLATGMAGRRDRCAENIVRQRSFRWGHARWRSTASSQVFRRDHDHRDPAAAFIPSVVSPGQGAVCSCEFGLRPGHRGDAHL
jgi:hypothetical protein